MWPRVPHVPAIIQQPDWSDVVQRAGDFKGDLLDVLSPSLDPSITVDDLTAFEYNWLRRRTAWTLSNGTGPTVGQFQSVNFQLAAPGLDNLIAVIDSLLLTNVTAAAYFVGIGLVAAAPGGNVGGGPRDGRQPLTSTSALRSATRTNAAALLAAAQYATVLVPLGGTVQLPLEFVLTNRFVDAAGNVAQLTIEALVVNTGISATLVYRERAMLTSER